MPPPALHPQVHPKDPRPDVIEPRPAEPGPVSHRAATKNKSRPECRRRPGSSTPPNRPANKKCRARQSPQTAEGPNAAFCHRQKTPGQSRPKTRRRSARLHPGEKMKYPVSTTRNITDARTKARMEAHSDTTTMRLANSLAPRSRERARERPPRTSCAPCAPEPPRASSPSPPHTCGGEGWGEEASSGFMGRGSLHQGW